MDDVTVAMNLLLEKKADDLVQKGWSLGEKFKRISFSEGPNADRIILISNPRTGKAGLLAVDSKSEVKQCKCFLISFKRWSWAEAEGFTGAELLDKFVDETGIFKEWKVDELPYALSIEGDP